MSTKIRVCKIWREFLTCVLGMILIFFIMGQIVQANEEQSESIEREETQEETLENFESSQITQEETSETLESTQTISEEESENLESTQTETSEEQVRPKELDLGEYLTEMFVGDKQLLIVTILPVNASESEVSYNSSNTEVAIVNGMGRIMALKEGKTKITVTCENVSESFELIVKEVQSTEIGVIELDLGDCPKEIIVGTSQILSVGVIPADATNTDFKYESNNPNVASVNALGRLTGNTLGTAEITVFCGDIRQKFQVTVIKDETKEKVEVTDIEISDYEEELKVDSTLGLSVTVLPKNATDTEVAYKSSDPKIATVNSSGEVKGISPGEVSIFVSAGKITKQARIKVKIATKAIDLNSVYQIMKPNDIFQIKAQVQPSDAPENMTYKSMDTKVAEVSNDGKIKAKSCGNTTIVISNGDLQVSLNIIE